MTKDDKERSKRQWLRYLDRLDAEMEANFAVWYAVYLRKRLVEMK